MTQHKGNFFSLPNDIFELGLSASAFLVYCYLRRCADRKTHQCYPSYETIGEAVKLCKNTVQKCVRELVDIGLIHTENTFVTTRDSLKRNGNLLYTILDITPVLAEAHQCKVRKIENCTVEPLKKCYAINKEKGLKEKYV